MARVKEFYPLSPLQEGILFECLLNQGAYIEQLSCRLEGEFDEGAFRQAWERVVERHAILRTGFVWEQLEQPVQVVRQRVELPWVQQDWRGLDKQQQQQELNAFLSQERERGFDLLQAPLLRLALHRCQESCWQFTWTWHHILLDGWSVALLLEEVFAGYQAFAAGEQPSLPERRAYRDYIAWLKQQDLGQAERFWRGQLQGFDSPTGLPVGREKQEFRGYETQELWLSEEATAGLGQMARQQQVTVNTVLQAAWGLLLGRYSGQTDVVFGAVVSGRPPALAGAEGMLGLFINTLPVRMQLPSQMSVAEWLRRLQAAQAQARQYEFTPLTKIQSWSDVPRGTSLFDSLLVFENYPVAKAAQMQSGKVRIDQLTFQEATTYTLTASAVPDGNLRLQIGFDTSKISRSAVGRLLGHWEELLRGIVADGRRAVGDLNMVTAEERRQLLEQGQREGVGTSQATVVELFEEQVALQPQARAVKDSAGNELSYGELNAAANRWARRLRRAGIGAESRVGIYLQRGCAVPVALLAVLKSGAAYVPLDPAYPAERLAYMAQDAGLALVISQASLATAIPEQIGASVPLLWLEEDDLSLESDNLEIQARPDNLAYIIYTSGSTGRPKGVMVSHAALATVLVSSLREFALQPGDQMPCMASFSFDISLFESMFPLLAGAETLVLTRDQAADPVALIQLLADVTVLHAVPALMSHLVEAILQQADLPVWCRRLRRMFVGGDAVPEQLLQRARLAFPTAELRVLYGPTESTIICAHTLVEAQVQGMMVGRPFPHATFRALDQQGRLSPVGVSGELYIGGAGVARGYVGQAGMTAERFLPDPYAMVPGQRVYRSGDLVRWREDGELEFQGRQDEQVKIRGFRIELGEIEAVLQQDGRVGEAAVAAVGGSSGEQRLVAFVVWREGEGEGEGEGKGEDRKEQLRKHLQRRLPEYMIPAVVQEVEALPLTANGKLDRKALAGLIVTGEETESYEGPRSPVEELLANIWAQVLQRERVGIHDNFFQLGGHSLLATQALWRIRSAFAIDLPLRSLFDCPSPAALAPRIEEALRSGLACELPAIKVADRSQGELPLSYAQQRLWFLDQLHPGSAAYNLPAAMRLRGSLQVGWLRGSLRGLVQRHEILRTSFPGEEGHPRQHIEMDPKLEMPVIDLSDLGKEEAEAEAERWARQEAGQAFNLATGPLLRARLLRVGEQEHVLLFTLHHIVSDGWSTGILVREFSALYEAEREARGAGLEPLGVQYGDYAVWQREWLEGERLQQQLGYWRKQLAPPWPVLELGWERARSGLGGSSAGLRAAGTAKLELSGELTQGLRGLSRQHGATLFMTLLGSLQLLLHRYTGESDIIVGTPVAGRGRSELQGLIGFFVNTLAIRCRVQPGLGFVDLLEQVRVTLLEAWSQQDVPLERVIEELQPERQLDRQPLFQILMSMQNGSVGSPELGGVEIELMSGGSPEAKFDLSLFLAEAGEGIQINVEYLAARFTAEGVGRLLGHWEELLRGIVADGRRAVGDLNMVTAEERRQLLEQGQREGVGTSQATVVELFEEQVALQPQARAVKDSAGNELSYGELNAAANRWARRLRRAGIGAESRVGIYLQRGCAVPVALLAVLKSGAAYVPLDPAYPAERLAYMAQDAGLALVISQASLATAIPEQIGASVPLLWLEEDDLSLESDNLEIQARPDNLAYIIYTSGSTGRPKGVMVSHAALATVLVSSLREFALQPGDQMPCMASFSFDISLFESMFPLLAGAETLVLTRDQAADPVALIQLLADVTVLHAVPALMSHLVEAILQQADLPVWCRRLRRMFVGGDAVPEQLLQRARLAFPTAELRVLYGPTESTIICAHTLVEAQVQGMMVGRPFPHATFRALDQQGRLSPVGVSGELYIGGAGVARGYVGQAGMTAERFLPDPYAMVPGQRVYRSGDLVRWREDGELEFQGRQDEQVKIRGFRIELGEIEAVLQQDGRVGEAAVAAVGGSSGEQRLVAFVVWREGEGEGEGEGKGEDRKEQLRKHLQRRLPEYMIPAVVQEVEALPLTANGKLDRKALAGLIVTGEETESYEGPRSPVEELLANIWAQVLQRERVGIHDNFFQLGGHSLLATQALWRIRSTFRIELPLRALFESPTVSGLAKTIENELIEQTDINELEHLLQDVHAMPEDDLDSILTEHAKPSANAKART